MWNAKLRGQKLKATHRTCLQLESLEDRRVPTVSLSGGIWSIQGTEFSDQIIINRDPQNGDRLRIFVNGNQEDAQPQSAIQRIDVDAGAGDDSVRVQPAVTPITTPVHFFGGAGDDELTGGAGNDVLD